MHEQWRSIPCHVVLTALSLLAVTNLRRYVLDYCVPFLARKGRQNRQVSALDYTLRRIPVFKNPSLQPPGRRACNGDRKIVLEFGFLKCGDHPLGNGASLDLG